MIGELANLTVVEGRTAEMICRITSGLHPHVVWVKHYQINGSYKGEDGTPYYRKMDPLQVNFYANKKKALRNVTSLSLSFGTLSARCLHVPLTKHLNEKKNERQNAHCVFQY